jgi:hypothetical protein
VYDAMLPGVLHNRHIVNYYTPERRTGPGFTAYQTRFAKFFLSMLYFNAVYADLAAAGEDLLDGGHDVRVPTVAEFVRKATALDRTENAERLDTLDRAYRRLGGRYAEFADLLAEHRERLLDEARRDVEDYALLAETWPALIASAAGTPLVCPPRNAG